MGTIKVSKTLSGMTFNSEVLFQDGVYVWASDGRVPPVDAVAEYGIDKLPGFNRALHDKARSEQVHMAIEEYRRGTDDNEPSREERFEVRAAFGPGMVINVLTGKRYRV